MKKERELIGIVTFTFGFNYGCHLQRYALQAVCERFGYRAQALLLSLDDLTLPDDPMRRLERRFKRFKKNCREGKYAAPYWSKLFAFRRFERQFLHTTKRFPFYKSVERRAEAMGFSAYIAGSDQVWNPLGMCAPHSYDYYMLGFAPSSKKIAYAPSLAVSKLSDEYVEKFRRYLSDFRFLSAREKEGAAELTRVLGRPVQCVLDPTLLLTVDDWDKVAAEARAQIPSDYILCYSLGNPVEVFNRALEIQKTLDRPIVCFEEFPQFKELTKNNNAKTILARNVGPCEFVKYVKNASCVVTDSYHGSIFSLLYHRPFFTMMRDSATQERSMNSRMTTLFSTFGLESRLFDPNAPLPAPLEGLDLDYDEVDRRLYENQIHSLNYLHNALSEVAGTP